MEQNMDKELTKPTGNKGINRYTNDTVLSKSLINEKKKKMAMIFFFFTSNFLSRLLVRTMTMLPPLSPVRDLDSRQ